MMSGTWGMALVTGKVEAKVKVKVPGCSSCPVGGPSWAGPPALLVALSIFHYYTAGFGILTEHWHKAIHVAAVLGLIFLMFPTKRNFGPTIGGIPLYDWTFALLVAAACLYLPMKN